ncbi:hypothetical protein GUJ93_ZPchr0013g34339 [Zizania palustris]|uniref:Uncharacterized protein n=1 Tax=Zizania palustris TaxID=103762 RepID=A0A8J5WS40_ZIZPA|nr:hypothetical protein GUJ93_ZPchr0013g34339 [Zizania palustris]
MHFVHEEIPDPTAPMAEAASAAASGVSSESSMEVLLAMPPIPPSPPSPLPTEGAGINDIILPIHLPVRHASPPEAAEVMLPPQRERLPIKFVYSRRPKILATVEPVLAHSPAQAVQGIKSSVRKSKAPLSDKELRRSLRLKIKSLGFKRRPSSEAGSSLPTQPSIEDFINISSDSDDPAPAPVVGAALGVASPPRTPQVPLPQNQNDDATI